MDTRRIAKLLEPFLEEANGQRPTTNDRPDNDALYKRISTYVDILLRWNDRINLTAIRTPEEIVTRHFGESLFAARLLFPTVTHVGTAAPVCPAERSSAVRAGHLKVEYGADSQTATDDERAGAAARVADLGSGAGFPGLPIKLWALHITLTLIESNHKKATFLREVTRALTLTNVDIQNVPAETLPASNFDLVTLRAVERLSAILPVAAALLAVGGRLCLLISAAQEPMVRSTLANFAWAPRVPVPSSASRILLTGRKQ
jgi:16S rRNA (guanine527-N7)-methyltransferase